MDLFLHLSDLRRSKDGGWLNVIYDDNCDDKKKRLLNISALNASDHSSGHSTNIKILEYLENSSDFLKLYSMNSMIAYNDNYDDVGTPLLSYQLNISISIYNSGMGNNNNNNNSMAIWQNNKLRKINETISPSKRFFRIGTAEVRKRQTERIVPIITIHCLYPCVCVYVYRHCHGVIIYVIQTPVRFS